MHSITVDTQSSQRAEGWREGGGGRERERGRKGIPRQLISKKCTKIRNYCERKRLHHQSSRLQRYVVRTCLIWAGCQAIGSVMRLRVNAISQSENSLE